MLLLSRYTLRWQTSADCLLCSVFERDGVRVVLDELTLELVHGCTVDYHTELIRAGFRITGNPKAESSCSCGVSFAPK